MGRNAENPTVMGLTKVSHETAVGPGVIKSPGYLRIHPNVPAEEFVKLPDQTAVVHSSVSETAVLDSHFDKEQLLKARQRERPFMLPERMEEIEFGKRCYINKPRPGASVKIKTKCGKTLEETG